jgi:hypothetical protein
MNPGDHVAMIWFIIAICVTVLLVLVLYLLQLVSTPCRRGSTDDASDELVTA